MICFCPPIAINGAQGLVARAVMALAFWVSNTGSSKRSFGIGGGPAGLPMAQFVMLNHFSHRPEEGKTITAIARAMQRPQPGVSKTVAKLIERQLLAWQPHPADRRSKLLFATAAGRDAHGQAVRLLGEEMIDAFEGWNKAEIHALFDQLDRLKIWFDGHRPALS